MQAVILAAGKSSRFYPYASFAHKSMISILGKPLLLHTIESLKKAHITNIVIIVGKDSSIPEELPKIPDLSIHFVTQQESRGMGDGLLAAEKYLEDSFMLLSGYHVDVAQFIPNLTKEKNKVVLLAKKDSSVDKFGVIETEGSRVISVVEKPKENSGEKLRLVSVYHLTKLFVEFLKTIPVEEYHFEKALNMYAENNEVLFVTTEKQTVSCKNTWDILDVKNYMLSGVKRNISSKAIIAKSAILEGEVYVSEGVTVAENAVIKGPCYLGENVFIGTNAILRNGVDIEKDAVVGATMEMKNSLLMQGATTHTGFIGDSIIGQYSRLAAGFCSANVRFDRSDISVKVKDTTVNTHKNHFGVVMGEHVDTGINVATMPGITIGNNVTVGPSTTVLNDIEDNMLFYTKFEQVQKRKK